MEQAKRFEANLADSGYLQDSRHSLENDGQDLSQHSHTKSVTAIDDVHERTIPAVLAPNETVQRNSKITQGLHKNNISFCAGDPLESLVELTALWPKLDDVIRDSILAIARKTVVE